uniref:Uncharacterized protein n=1 Tax=Plectus sambesii TaxID=2011161 RepID=A0A914VWH2_9BILA
MKRTTPARKRCKDDTELVADGTSRRALCMTRSESGLRPPATALFRHGRLKTAVNDDDQVGNSAARRRRTSVGTVALNVVAVVEPGDPDRVSTDWLAAARRKALRPFHGEFANAIIDSAGIGQARADKRSSNDFRRERSARPPTAARFSAYRPCRSPHSSSTAARLHSRPPLSTGAAAAGPAVSPSWAVAPLSTAVATSARRRRRPPANQTGQLSKKDSIKISSTNSSALVVGRRWNVVGASSAHKRFESISVVDVVPGIRHVLTTPESVPDRRTEACEASEMAAIGLVIHDVRNWSASNDC